MGTVIFVKLSLFIFVPLLKHFLNIIFAEVLIKGSCARKSEHPAHLAKAISSSCPVPMGKLSSAGKVPSTMRAGDLDCWDLSTTVDSSLRTL